MEVNEVWKPIFEFEDNYAVSNLGRVKRLEHLSKNSMNDSYRTLKERLMSNKLRNKKKYITCKLSIDGKIYYRQLHRVVLTTFKLHKKYTELEVNHIDGDKHNNHLNNLEWVTRKENVKHAKDNGLLKPAKGENNGKSKITQETVKQIRRLRKENMEYKEISNITGTTNKIVGDIIRKRTWKHLE